MFQRFWLRPQFAAAISGLLLCGCTSAAVQTPTLAVYGSSYDMMFPNDDTDREALPSQYYQHALPVDLKQLHDGASQMLDPYGKKLDVRSLRNLMQNELLRRSDQTCSAYQSRLIHGYIVGETGIKATQAILGVVKTLTAPFELFSNAVGGLAGGVTSSLNGDVLKWKAFEEANQRIHFSRRNLHNVIRNAQQLGADKYTVSQAVYDAERYHSYCNIAMALVGGNEWIAKEANEQIVPKGIFAADLPPGAAANAPDAPAKAQ